MEMVHMRSRVVRTVSIFFGTVWNSKNR